MLLSSASPPLAYKRTLGPLIHLTATRCCPFSFGNGELTTTLFFRKRPDVDRGVSGSLSYCPASASHRLEPLGEDLLAIRPPLTRRRSRQGRGLMRPATRQSASTVARGALVGRPTPGQAKHAGPALLCRRTGLGCCGDRPGRPSLVSDRAARPISTHAQGFEFNPFFLLELI
jgi:hypothetical protein